MNLSMPRDLLMSEDFAVLLGLKESPARGLARDEIERLSLVNLFSQRNQLESESQQRVIWSRFSALYLPGTISRYLNLPDLINVADPEFKLDYTLYNAYLEMLVQLQDNPYFTKFFNSTKPLAAPGKRLPAVLAQRLLDLAPRLDRRMLAPPSDRPTLYYESFTGSCIQLLSTLLAIFVKAQDQEAVVPTATRRGLLPWLQKWSLRYRATRSPDPFLGGVCARTFAQLSPDVDFKGAVKAVRRELKSLDVCALPSCGVKANNKACSKCKTVCYVDIFHFSPFPHN